MGIIFSSFNGLEAKLPYIKFSTSQWQQKNFSDLFTILSNNTHSRAELTNYGTIRNIHYGDVLIKFGNILDTSQAEIPYLCENCKYKDEYMQDGDIIIADTAEDYTAGKCTELFNVGTSKIISGLHTIPCRPKIKFAQKYLGYYTNSPAYRHQLLSLLQGIKVYSISKTNLSNTHVSYPPLPEQQKIADFLSLVDQRIEKQRQLIESLKKYKRGLFQYIYCNKSVNWEKKTVKDFSIAYGGYAFDSKLYDKKGFYKIITIGNVTGKRYISTDCNHIKSIPLDLQEHQYLKNGDIVISMTGNVGRVSLVNIDNCLLNQRVAKVIIKDACLKEYMYQVLSASNFEQEMNNRGQGAAQKNIKNSDIENFIFYIPKDYNKVKKISSTLYHLDILIEKTDSILEALIAFKKGLLQQMFI